jgi:uncharacterized Zn finger protein
MLIELITEKNLRSLAGGRSYSRGEDYFESGHVGPVSEKNGVIFAKVHGSNTYEVRLKVVPAEKGKVCLDHTCTCPVGRDGDFCKHCVALGLVWLEKTAATLDETSAEPSRPGKNKTVTMQDIRKWLEGQDRNILLDMLMEQVQGDGHLREALLLKIARENARGIDMTAYRSGIRSAFHTGGFVDYYDMGDYAAGVDEEIAKIERLFKEGFADETVNLCEYALERATRSIGDVDDSDGHFCYIAERLQDLHLAACKKAKPEPVALAKRLFDFEIADGDLEIFSGAVDAYKSVLGKEGFTEYRRFAEAEWAKVPAKIKGDESNFGRRYAITRIMESLARADGDIDGLIAIKKRDLSSSHRFLDIARILKDAKRYDEALEWTEKGLHSFKERPDDDLRDFLAEEYHRRKRHDEAYALYRLQFVERPQLEYYRKFIGYAKKVKREEEARDEALSWLRQAIEKEKKAPTQHYWYGKPDHSRLVEIFLWEKDIEAAWKEAGKGGCRDELWLKLAQLRENEHPADAVGVYQRLVEPVIDRKKNDAYEEAVRMIAKIQELMEKQGEAKEFAAYLANVRLRHKPKRNLMKLLEKV